MCAPTWVGHSVSTPLHASLCLVMHPLTTSLILTGKIIVYLPALV